MPFLAKVNNHSVSFHIGKDDVSEDFSYRFPGSSPMALPSCINRTCTQAARFLMTSSSPSLTSGLHLVFPVAFLVRAVAGQ